MPLWTLPAGSPKTEGKDFHRGCSILFVYWNNINPRPAVAISLLFWLFVASSIDDAKQQQQQHSFIVPGNVIYSFVLGKSLIIVLEEMPPSIVGDRLGPVCLLAKGSDTGGNHKIISGGRIEGKWPHDSDQRGDYDGKGVVIRNRFWVIVQRSRRVLHFTCVAILGHFFKSFLNFNRRLPLPQAKSPLTIHWYLIEPIWILDSFGSLYQGY